MTERHILIDLSGLSSVLGCSPVFEHTGPCPNSYSWGEPRDDDPGLAWSDLDGAGA